MRKFICTSGWIRNKKGEILTQWEYNRLPQEIKDGNFEEYFEPIPEPEVALNVESAVVLTKEEVKITEPVQATADIDTILTGSTGIVGEPISHRPFKKNVGNKE